MEKGEDAGVKEVGGRGTRPPKGTETTVGDDGSEWDTEQTFPPDAENLCGKD